ncbi:MAG: hypothetical protein NZM28_00185 [Fimbriimonadales bacterium]|nr:hypothetical protein [Fimbriimonadales bacterium]
MTVSKWLRAASAILALSIVASLSAQVFTYQGFLRQNNLPVNGTVSMTFRLYTASTGGTLLGTVGPVSVVVSNGLFTRELDFGSVWNGDARWLEIQVGSQTLSPRVRINPAPYAITASSALGLQGHPVGTAAPATGQVLKWSGSAWTPANDQQESLWQPSGSNIFYTAGRVGIGTNAPAFALEVNASAGSDAVFVRHTGAGRGLQVVAGSDTAIWGITTSGFAAIDGWSIATRGVYGRAEASTGTTIGVEGVSLSPQGRGVQGLNLAPSGEAYGGLFATQSPSGVAVYAVADRNTGTNYGILARTNSPNGFGGLFQGRVMIEAVSDASRPTLRLHQPDTSYARIEFTNANTARRWHIAALIGNTVADDRLNFWNVQTGDIICIAGNGRVGVRTFSPQVELDVNGTARVRTLEIQGADLAEKFPVSEPVEPGMVVEIDPDRHGSLRKARGAYNKRVAGVVAGANGLPTGIVLGNTADGETHAPVAMSGRVWVYADATKRAIEPGDLLTTSDRPGYAMAVAHPRKAHGAILGKAMTRLEKGKTGMVLMLVNLQ